MHLTRADIQEMERIRRLNIINSITGIKPANLIGTVSNDGDPNLAIFSSVLHLGSDPALLGFMLRPQEDVRRHTYENIKENGFYTINHIHHHLVEQAHYTSAKFDKKESEFKECSFTEEYLFDFRAPFVQESKLKLGMKFLESIPIETNNTLMIIGTVEYVLIPDDAVDEKGDVNLEILGSVGVSGLGSYYRMLNIGQFPYARKSELPGFTRNTA